MSDNDVLIQIRGDVADINAKLADLKGNIGKVNTELKKTADDGKNHWDGFRGHIDNADAKLKVFIGTMIGLGTAYELINLGKNALETGDKISKLSESTGIAAETLSGLSYAAKMSDVDTDSLAKCLGRLSKASFAAATANDDTVSSLKRLKIDVKDSAGNFRDVESILGDVADKFSAMPDGVSKTALAMQIFGRAGAVMIPMLNKGRDGLEELHGEAEKLGLILDRDTARAMEEVNDNFKKLHLAATGTANKLLLELLPSLAQLTHAMIGMRKESGDLHEYGQSMRIMLQGLVSMVLGVAAAFDLAGSVVGEFFARTDEGDEKGFGTLDAKAEKWGTLIEKIWNPPAIRIEPKKDLGPDKSPVRDFDKDRLKQLTLEEKALKSVIEGYKALADASVESNKRLISDRELSLKLGLSTEEDYLKTRSDLENENVRITVDSLEKQEAATIASYEKRLKMHLKPMEKEKVMEDYIGALIKVQGDLAREGQKSVEQWNQGMITAIDYSRKLAAAIREGEYNIMTELARQENEVNALRVERYEMEPGEASKTELKWASDLLFKKRENLLEDYYAATADQDRIKIWDQMKVVNAQLLAQQETAWMKQEKADLEGANRDFDRQAAAKISLLDLAKLVGNYEEQYRIESQLLKIEKERALMQPNLSADQSAALEKLYAEKERRATLMLSDTGKIRLALEDTGKEMTDTFSNVREVVSNSFKGMSDSLTEFVMTGKMTFSELANSIVRDIVRIQMQAAMGNLSKASSGGLDWLGGLFGPSYEQGLGNIASGAADAGLALSDVLAAFHSGGVPGIDAPQSYRIVPNLNFPRAPRFHTGIGPGERAAVITDDEGVFTPGQMAALGRGMIRAQNNAADSPDQGSQGPTNIFIYAIDSKSFEDICRKNPGAITAPMLQGMRDNKTRREMKDLLR